MCRCVAAATFFVNLY